MKINEDSYKGINFCQHCGSKLNLVGDEEGKLRPRCSECGWTFYKNPIPASACVILNDKNEVVLIKRKFAPSAGSWALPSGYVEIYQSPGECAVDEMLEETGLVGEVERFLAYVSDDSPIYEKVISFGYLMRVTGGRLQAGDDASDARYVPLDKLPGIPFFSHQQFIDIAKEIIGYKK